MSYAQLACAAARSRSPPSPCCGPARDRLSRLGFYLLFALVVTASVQLVGVYLVFATLIVPALGARNHPESRRLAIAYGVGIAGYAAGLLLSSALDLPTGAMVVWCLAALAAAAHAAAPPRQRAPASARDRTARSARSGTRRR